MITMFDHARLNRCTCCLSTSDDSVTLTLTLHTHWLDSLAGTRSRRIVGVGSFAWDMCVGIIYTRV
jgi:hypothetical protein